jgi:hypothetical protein
MTNVKVVDWVMAFKFVIAKKSSCRRYEYVLPASFLQTIETPQQMISERHQCKHFHDRRKVNGCL